MIPRAKSVSVSAELRSQCFHSLPPGFTITVTQNLRSAFVVFFSEFHPAPPKRGTNRYTSTPSPDTAFAA